MEIKLIGKDYNGVEHVFGVMAIDGPIDEGLAVVVENGCATLIDPATIRLADDPRKAMLNEIRNRVKDFGKCDEYVLVATFNTILDEMEAKL